MNHESAMHSNTSTKRKSTFSLGTMLCVLTLIVILTAWFVDHQRLSKQIPPIPEKKPAQVYRLNAPAELVAEKMNEMLESGEVISETVSNSIIVVAPVDDLTPIENMIRYVDLNESDLVKNQTNASNDESKALPIPAK